MFSNPILGGDGILIRNQIRSDNYSPGVAGWSIMRDGTAEFSDVTVRGDVVATSFATDVAPNDRIEVTSVDLGSLLFFAQAAADASLQARSFLLSGSRYIGAVEGPDNHPTDGRPFVYLISDASGATNTQAGIGLVSGPQVLCDGSGSVAIFTEPTGPTATFDAGASNIVSMRTNPTNGAGLVMNDGTDQILMETALGAGPYVLLDGTAGTAVMSNETAFIECNNVDSVVASVPTGQGFLVTVNSVIQLDVNATTATFTPQVILNGGAKAPGFGTSAAALQPVHYDNTFAPGTLYRFTSSGKFKRNIRDAGPVLGPGNPLAGLRVRSFQPLANFRGRDALDDHGPERVGFIAEEVAALNPRWAIVDGDGTPVGVDTEQIVAALVLAVQRLYDRFATNPERGEPR